jgi:hypothetical protein
MLGTFSALIAHFTLFPIMLMKQLYYSYHHTFPLKVLRRLLLHVLPTVYFERLKSISEVLVCKIR